MNQFPGPGGPEAHNGRSGESRAAGAGWAEVFFRWEAEVECWDPVVGDRGVDARL